MPGTTSLGIRYPYQNEVVTAQSWQDMADDIDALFTSLDALTDLARLKPSASISGGAAATATNNNGIPTNYTTVNWDTGGYANLGVNPDRLTVPSGVYWGFCSGFLSGATTVTAKRVGLLHNSIVWGAQTVDILTGTGNGTISPGSGMIICTGVTNVIQVRCIWTGTGGPATTGSVTLSVYKIRELADL